MGCCLEAVLLPISLTRTFLIQTTGRTFVGNATDSCVAVGGEGYSIDAVECHTGSLSNDDGYARFEKNSAACRHEYEPRLGPIACVVLKQADRNSKVQIVSRGLTFSTVTKRRSDLRIQRDANFDMEIRTLADGSCSWTLQLPKCEILWHCEIQKSEPISPAICEKLQEHLLSDHRTASTL